MEDIVLTASNKLFINRSICPYYKYYDQRARNCITWVKFIDFFISGDTVKIKINESSAPLPVTHVDDFENYFPDVVLLLPSS